MTAVDATVIAKPVRRAGTRRSRERAAWGFVAPSLIAIGLFFAVPVFSALLLSLTDFDIYALADIANGTNGRNLTFQRYVLAALLDDVLRAASLRLAAMSRGRYQLQRREDLADARRAGGLDLEVFDEYTGRSRPASTLSGGEGFMASLSLALGLSDVVQAYAGGVQLDTLFIDEGFGSLDPESLDMAMKALIDLQQRNLGCGQVAVGWQQLDSQIA